MVSFTWGTMKLTLRAHELRLLREALELSVRSLPIAVQRLPEVRQVSLRLANTDVTSALRLRGGLPTLATCVLRREDEGGTRWRLAPGTTTSVSELVVVLVRSAR